MCCFLFVLLFLFLPYFWDFSHLCVKLFYIVEVAKSPYYFCSFQAFYDLFWKISVVLHSTSLIFFFPAEFNLLVSVTNFISNIVIVILLFNSFYFSLPLYFRFLKKQKTFHLLFKILDYGVKRLVSSSELFLTNLLVINLALRTKIG